MLSKGSTNYQFSR